MKNEHGIKCEIGKFSDDEHFRIVTRFADNEIFIEGHRTERGEKRNRNHYFLQSLTREQLQQVHDDTGEMLEWIKENS